MHRRRFFEIAAGGITLSSWSAAKPENSNSNNGLPLFESDNEQVLKLARDVFQKCVLDRIVPAVPPLEHNWVYPGGPYYKGQWIWDSMFVVDLLSILPGKEKVIRDIFRNYWDFQDRWNRKMPAHAQDMITAVIKTAPQEERRFSQLPLLAWGVERVYRRNGDKQLLDMCLGRLERFHEWFWRERDVTDVGLCTVGSYSGVVQHARWETFDYECNMDDLHLTKHPSRKGPDEGAWYGDICVTGNTSCLIMAERSLARLAETSGDHAMAARRKVRIEKSVAAMRKHMWDEKQGLFLSVRRDTLEKIPASTIGGWLPLTAGVPDKAMAERMAAVLATNAWQTPLPVPTVDRNDPRWKSSGFWRGDVWPSTNYLIASGLADYGYRTLASDIADKTVANAIQNGINEHYDSVTGKGIGVSDYCMSSSLVTMMLDELTKTHHLGLREKNRGRS